MKNLNNYKSFKAFIESPHPSSKHSTYFSAYDDIFTKYIGKEIIFVEVGVLGGGSLFMWKNFFRLKKALTPTSIKQRLKLSNLTVLNWDEISVLMNQMHIHEQMKLGFIQQKVKTKEQNTQN